MGGDSHGGAQCPIVLSAAIDDDVVVAVFQAEQVVANVAIKLNAVDFVAAPGCRCAPGIQSEWCAAGRNRPVTPPPEIGI